MPAFHDTAVSPAPPEEVWKALYDPRRFPDWWVGIETVEAVRDGGYTAYPDGYPDFPMAQLLRTDQQGRKVVISCLVSDLRFEWRLSAEGVGTRIDVDVEIPEHEAARLETQRECIAKSLRKLAAVA
jgi:Polyketide cyclase / dehydrase and lipid transport